MLQAAKAAGQITKTNKLHRDHVAGDDMMTFTLEDTGISRDLSSKAQKIAAISKEDFEKRVATVPNENSCSSSVKTSRR
jgi:hypothetical protein